MVVQGTVAGKNVVEVVTVVVEVVEVVGGVGGVDGVDDEADAGVAVVVHVVVVVVHAEMERDSMQALRVLYNDQMPLTIVETSFGVRLSGACMQTLEILRHHQVGY